MTKVKACQRLLNDRPVFQSAENMMKAGLRVLYASGRMESELGMDKLLVKDIFKKMVLVYVKTCGGTKADQRQVS